jgi:hypothetical protein
VGPSITAVGAKERSCLVKHWPETGIFVSGQHQRSVVAVGDFVMNIVHGRELAESRLTAFEWHNN